MECAPGQGGCRSPAGDGTRGVTRLCHRPLDAPGGRPHRDGYREGVRVVAKDQLLRRRDQASVPAREAHREVQWAFEVEAGAVGVGAAFETVACLLVLPRHVPHFASRCIGAGHGDPRVGPARAEGSRQVVPVDGLAGLPSEHGEVGHESTLSRSAERGRGGARESYPAPGPLGMPPHSHAGGA